MGPEVGLLMALGGTGLSMLGQQEAAGERRDILNRSMARTAKATDQANAALLREGAQMSGDQRMTAMQAQTDANTAQANQDLRGSAALDGSGNAIIDTAGDAGAVSADYLRAKADKALSEGQRMSSIARELAKVRAPGQMASSEAQRRAATTGDLNSMWSTTRNLANAAQADADSVEEPWWGQLGKVAAMIGGAAGGMPGGATGGMLPDTLLTGMQLGQNGARSTSGLNFSTVPRGAIRFG